MNTLHTLVLERRRDLLVVRSRLRQIAGLLGFDPLEQAKIACTAFELAAAELDLQTTIAMTVALDGRLLRVWLHHPLQTTPPKLTDADVPQLSVNVPDTCMRMAADDIAWAVEQLMRLHKPDLFAELRQHNQDLLCVLTLLQQTQSGEERTAKPFAA